MRSAKTLIATTVLAAFCLTGAASAGIMLDRVVAVVNDEAITWGELYRAMEFELARDMRSLSVEQKKAIFEENESLFLEKMINTKLQLQAAERLGIRANERELNAAIEGVKNKYSLNDEQFREALRNEGFTLEEYRERLREQIVIGKVLEVEVKSRIFISEEDMGDIPPGDGFYRLKQIFFKAGPGAEEKAQAVMAELGAGADFGELARKYSEDPLASSGGDLGMVQKSKMAKEFAQAVEGLKPGEVSQPFETSNGIHILKVEQVRGVRDVLTEERFVEAYADWLRSLRERAFIEIRL